MHHDAEGLDAGRDHGLHRMHGAVHIALPGIGEESGSPDPATTLRATGFAPHRAPRSYPHSPTSRTITRPDGTLTGTVGAAAGGSAAAILLYESALGLGMACGPLLGALLGNQSWRYPFFGTAFLMAVGFLCITAFLKEQPKPPRKTSLLDPVKALGHGGLASDAGHLLWSGLLDKEYGELVGRRLLEPDFFSGWGVRTLVLLAVDVLVLGYGSHATAVICTILSGAFIGVNNTVYTELALGVPDAPRPVASAGYNFVRWFAAAAAPHFAPKIEEWSDIHIPFVVAAVTAVLGAVVVFVRRNALTHDAEELEPRHAAEDGVAVFAN